MPNQDNETDRPARWRRGIACSIGLLAAIVLVICWLMYHGITPGTIETLIQAEVPTKANLLEIEQWFDAHHIASHFSDKPNCLYFRGCLGRDALEVAGVKSIPLRGVVCGTCTGKDVNVSPVFDGEITAYFFLDAEGKLVAHYVDPVPLVW